MMKSCFAFIRPTLLSIGLLAVAGVGFAESPAEAQGRKQRQDARTCASFGLSYGTPAFADCMLEQQHRRDLKRQRKLEEMALTSQIAKDGQIMAERARRQRCEKSPDRRECRPR